MTHFKISETERAILANQNRILSVLNETNADKYSFRAEVFTHGYERLYESALGLLGEVSYEVCKETTDILNMYRDISSGSVTLTEDQKQSLNINRIRFEGFDANETDGHYHIAMLLIEHKYYKEYATEDLNSHSSHVMSKYRRMLDVVTKFDDKHHMTPDNLRELIECV